MAKYRAIPQGFMTVGEAAKKTGVTVRTLQYYDKDPSLGFSTIFFQSYPYIDFIVVSINAGFFVAKKT